MLYIAVCDDEIQQLRYIYGLLEEYMSSRNLPLRIKEFSSGKELMDSVNNGTEFDMFLLDIVMPEMNGIELGMRLRLSDRSGEIIYLTASPDYAVESYQTRAFFYLLKPIQKEQLFLVLDEAVKSRNKKIEQSFKLKTREGTRLIMYDDLLYAELNNRSIRYYLQDGSFWDSMTMTRSFKDAVSGLLEDERFFLCGASFLVNLYHVRMVDKKGARLTNGKYLELPKTACGSLRTAWFDYSFDVKLNN